MVLTPNGVRGSRVASRTIMAAHWASATVVARDCGKPDSESEYVRWRVLDVTPFQEFDPERREERMSHHDDMLRLSPPPSGLRKPETSKTEDRNNTVKHDGMNLESCNEDREYLHRRPMREKSLKIFWKPSYWSAYQRKPVPIKDKGRHVFKHVQSIQTVARGCVNHVDDKLAHALTRCADE